jgi:hypothetical protein
LAAFLRLRRSSGGAFERSDSDPADELRARLEQARDTAGGGDELDAAETQPVQGPPVEPAEPPRSIEERRRAIHEKAQQALGQMSRSDADE